MPDFLKFFEGTGLPGLIIAALLVGAWKILVEQIRTMRAMQKHLPQIVRLQAIILTKMDEYSDERFRAFEDDASDKD